MLFYNKKEPTTDACYNMNAPQKHIVKWKKHYPWNGWNTWYVKSALLSLKETDPAVNMLYPPNSYENKWKFPLALSRVAGWKYPWEL